MCFIDSASKFGRPRISQTNPRNSEKRAWKLPENSAWMVLPFLSLDSTAFTHLSILGITGSKPMNLWAAVSFKAQKFSRRVVACNMASGVAELDKTLNQCLYIILFMYFTGCIVHAVLYSFVLYTIVQCIIVQYTCILHYCTMQSVISAGTPPGGPRRSRRSA